MGMGNVLSPEKREQVIALGRLGWSLPQIEESMGVRRETTSDYLRSAGVPLGSPGGWGHLDCTEAAKCRSVADHRVPGISVSNDAWYDRI